jgi:16S rRNA (guanine527-N7)-methyltransferase
VAPLERLARWCLPLVAPHGELVALKGASAAEEIIEAGPALARLGCDNPVVEEVGGEVLESPTRVVRLPRPEAGPVGWRARGAPARGRRTRRQRRNG